MLEDLSASSEGSLTYVSILDIPEPGELLGVLYKEHYDALTRYARSLNRSKEEAAEVVQDVFAHFVEQRDVLERQRNPVSFLFRSVRNHALNRMRGERALGRELKRYSVDSRTVRHVATNDGETALFIRDIESWCGRLIDRLPKKQRDVFRLVKLCGLSYTEVARLLRIRSSTINTHVTRATQTLASQLSELGLLDGSVRPDRGLQGKRQRKA